MSFEFIVNLTGLKQLLWRQKRVLVSYYTRLRQTRGKRAISPYDASALPLIGSLGWLTIKELINFETSKMVYKSLNVLAPDYLRDLFQKVSEATNRQLRNSSTDLRLPLLRTSTGQKSFAYRGAKVWSDLDSVVKASTSFSSFRRNYKAKL